MQNSWQLCHNDSVGAMHRATQLCSNFLHLPQLPLTHSLLLSLSVSFSCCCFCSTGSKQRATFMPAFLLLSARGVLILLCHVEWQPRLRLDSDLFRLCHTHTHKKCVGLTVCVMMIPSMTTSISKRNFSRLNIANVQFFFFMRSSMIDAFDLQLSC